MTTKTSKTIMFASMIAIGAALVFGITNFNVDGAVQPDIIELTIEKEARGIDKYLASDSAVKAVVSTDRISLGHGQIQTIPIVIEHMSDSKIDGSFTITPYFSSYVFTDSVMQTTTTHDRATMISEGKLPSGIIPYSDFITFEPPFVNLKAGESKQIMMKISANDKLDGIDGVIGVNPHLQVSDKQNVEKVGVFSFYIDVDVGGK